MVVTGGGVTYSQQPVLGRDGRRQRAAVGRSDVHEQRDAPERHGRRARRCRSSPGFQVRAGSPGNRQRRVDHRQRRRRLLGRYGLRAHRRHRALRSALSGRQSSRKAPSCYLIFGAMPPPLNDAGAATLARRTWLAAVACIVDARGDRRGHLDADGRGSSRSRCHSRRRTSSRRRARTAGSTSREAVDWMRRASLDAGGANAALPLLKALGHRRPSRRCRSRRAARPPRCHGRGWRRVGA